MIKALLINLAVLLLLLFCFEVVLRATDIGFDSAAFVPDRILHHVHKKNYTFINDNPAASEFSGILIHYDEEGRVSNPDPEANIPSQKPALKIALLGDSFTEAAQVNYSESFAGLLQKRFADTVSILNYGVGEYSPVFYYLQSVNQLENEKYDYAIMLLYSNDVRDDSVYSQKADRDAKGNILGINGGDRSWRAELARKSYLLRLIRKYYIRLVYWYDHKNEKPGNVVGDYLEEKPYLSPLTKSFIYRTDSVLAQSGTRLVLSAVPSKYKVLGHLEHDSTDFANQVKDLAMQLQLPYIDLVPAFQGQGDSSLLFFPKDIHFNKNGHALVAKTFENFISRQLDERAPTLTKN